MHRFWDTLIGPMLERLQPRTIVEIGSSYGPNTRNLLEFCQRYGARLHVVDPMPKYDVAAWEERYGERLIFHTALSLDAIPKIDSFDVVLIDGDHNWYTVFNELGLIEDRCAELSQPFPLMMLHDVGWPYGRRDGYYSPEDIPDEYLNPYDRKGMRPGQIELSEEGGLNSRFRNAIREGGRRNGVLTAVEDFLEQTEQEIELVTIPGLHGLGILVPLHLKPMTREFLETFDLPPNVLRYIERIEEARLQAEIARQEQGAVLRRLRARRKRDRDSTKQATGADGSFAE